MPCGGRLVGSGDNPKEWYNSLGECSKDRQIPFEILSRARAIAPTPHDGFTKNGRIFWQELQPMLEERYDEFAAQLPKEDREREILELKKLKEEVIKLTNFNKTKSKDFISRKLVLKTINSLYGNVFTQLSRYLEFEMPSKCDGMSSVQLKQYNKDFLIRLLSGLKNQEKIWREADDMSVEDPEVKPE